MIYLESSAIVKLVHDEPETEALKRWLAGFSGTPMATSALTRVEVTRVTMRANPAALPEMQAVLAKFDLVPISNAVLDQAIAVGDPFVRSLDAIQVASAISLGSGLTALVTYDRRMFAAAQAARLAPTSPGLS